MAEAREGGLLTCLRPTSSSDYHLDVSGSTPLLRVVWATDSFCNLTLPAFVEGIERETTCVLRLAWTIDVLIHFFESRHRSGRVRPPGHSARARHHKLPGLVPNRGKQAELCR